MKIILKKLWMFLIQKDITKGFMSCYRNHGEILRKEGDMVLLALLCICNI